MNPGIYHGDCLQLIPQIRGGVSLCIADPPYGIGFKSNQRADKKALPKILNDEAPFVDWIKPLFEQMSDGGRLVCFYRWDVQDEFLDAILSAGFTAKSQIVWDKVVHGMGDLNGEFAPAHELAIYATKGRREFTGTRPKTVYRCQRVNPNDLIHPNEKPVNLMAALVRDLTTKDELVLDPFGGSFSTYRACQKEGRRCISFELHDQYFESGKHLSDKGYTAQLF